MGSITSVPVISGTCRGERMANSDEYTQVDTQKVEAVAEREKTGGEEGREAEGV